MVAHSNQRSHALLTAFLKESVSVYHDQKNIIIEQMMRGFCQTLPIDGGCSNH